MASLLEIIYLIASVTFIIGLKRLSHPATARMGNLMAAGGMGAAIFATIFLYRDAAGNNLHNLGWIFLAIGLGTLVGAVVAKKVQMTAMPQMVSIFNGMGGACAALISLMEYQHGSHDTFSLIVIFLGLIIGSVSFAGSVIAWGKLEGKIGMVLLPLKQVLNFALLGSLVGIAAWLTIGHPQNAALFFYVLFALSLLYGILFVLPIGGADMPVVISLLNSFTGVAAACGGFLYDNKAMLTGGILVGSAGTILTVLMCKAMNRSLLNVVLGAFGGDAGAGPAGEVGDQSVREISHTDCGILMSYARKVIIVPGYGMAVAQAQHTCNELEKLLESKGVEVNYAIHPVAGRMPGHMNVLLAEADVSYDKLLEMDDANPQFPSTDVAVVIGANDVVNPAAKKDPSSAIYGMPILEVEEAKNIIVMKRSMGKGYAGIENELFFADKTRMLFGDAKASLQKLVEEVKNS